MPDNTLEPGSFRDCNGRVFYSGTATYRALSNKALTDWRALDATEFFSRKVDAGEIVKTEYLENIDGITAPPGDWAAFLNHQTIPYISYPYEWSFSMLRDAALLHLELLLDALDEGMILKDSSAYNIQWQGTRPVFIDIPSFEVLPPGEPWVGYRQFCQLFLYPLFLQAYRNIEFHPWLRGNIDGIDPVQMNNLMSLWDRIRPGVFTHVYLQAKMQEKFGSTRKDVKNDLINAGFSKELIRANVSRTRKLVESLQWASSESQWSGYATTHSYTDSDHDIKAGFVEHVAASRDWGHVWDIGCNTGKFSRIAARRSDYVIAMDADHLCIDSLYRTLQEEDVNNILPLYINMADASPNLGWRGLERKSLVRRGTPDLILCLALVHHIVIGANVPLQEFIAWLASLEAALLIEFVSRDDDMVKTLLRNREDQYYDYTPESFRHYMEQLFDIQRTEPLKDGARQLYFATPKATSAG